MPRTKYTGGNYGFGRIGTGRGPTQEQRPESPEEIRARELLEALAGNYRTRTLAGDEGQAQWHPPAAPEFAPQSFGDVTGQSDQMYNAAFEESQFPSYRGSREQMETGLEEQNMQSMNRPGGGGAEELEITRTPMKEKDLGTFGNSAQESLARLMAYLRGKNPYGR